MQINFHGHRQHNGIDGSPIAPYKGIDRLLNCWRSVKVGKDVYNKKKLARRINQMYLGSQKLEKKGLIGYIKRRLGFKSEENNVKIESSERDIASLIEEHAREAKDINDLISKVLERKASEVQVEGVSLKEIVKDALAIEGKSAEDLKKLKGRMTKISAGLQPSEQLKDVVSKRFIEVSISDLRRTPMWESVIERFSRAGLLKDESVIEQMKGMEKMLRELDDADEQIGEWKTWFTDQSTLKDELSRKYTEVEDQYQALQRKANAAAVEGGSSESGAGTNLASTDQFNGGLSLMELKPIQPIGREKIIEFLRTLNEQELTEYLPQLDKDFISKEALSAILRSAFGDVCRGDRREALRKFIYDNTSSRVGKELGVATKISIEREVGESDWQIQSTSTKMPICSLAEVGTIEQMEERMCLFISKSRDLYSDSFSPLFIGASEAFTCKDEQKVIELFGRLSELSAKYQGTTLIPGGIRLGKQVLFPVFESGRLIGLGDKDKPCRGLFGNDLVFSVGREDQAQSDCCILFPSEQGQEAEQAREGTLIVGSRLPELFEKKPEVSPPPTAVLRSLLTNKFPEEFFSKAKACFPKEDEALGGRELRDYLLQRHLLANEADYKNFEQVLRNDGSDVLGSTVKYLRVIMALLFPDGCKLSSNLMRCQEIGVPQIAFSQTDFPPPNYLSIDQLVYVHGEGIRYFAYEHQCPKYQEKQAEIERKHTEIRGKLKEFDEAVKKREISEGLIKEIMGFHKNLFSSLEGTSVQKSAIRDKNKEAMRLKGQMEKALRFWTSLKNSELNGEAAEKIQELYADYESAM